MSHFPIFTLTGCKSQTSTPPVRRHTCEARGTPSQQMAEPQQECNSFSVRTAAPNRRHSSEETIGPGSGPAPERGPAGRFHPYRRQFSDGAMETAGRLHQSASSFTDLQEGSSPDTCSCSSDVPTAWEQYNGSVQSLYSEPPAGLVDPYGSLSQRFSSYGPLSPLQQVPSKLYPNDTQPESSKYSVQSQTHQDSSAQSIFPKPIYSYSILIFMALKNSKTGSLPVSEIYSFMTEHFPYFKTAPDGWKNSVRHNLSLNKCFEKVENKNGSTSRKGCLWALNPAKVEKMQDELHKWRRKDPLTVRRSMARPEDLERLLGEKPDKLRSLPPYSTRVAPVYSPTSSPLTPAQPPIQSSQYAHLQPGQHYYLPPVAAQPGNSFALYSHCGQQPTVDVPLATGCLNSPVAGKRPRICNVGLPVELSVDPRGMQDLLQEGDTSYDIDTLNPSLTDLQLQDNLWEELREDSLISDPRVTNTSSTTFVLQDHHIQTGCPQVSPPFCPTSVGAAGGCYKVAYEDEDADRRYWNGLHPVGYSGIESLAGCLTSCTTSVTLM
ncbi:forkhead box protein N1 [Nematolebias whitei]|uniref:forkhead box protein N1 n=1 Tax=Nematolebias whitei TaxID=451745 RepID=UPI00189BAAC5|nr:forkhead box protein N1 [Nematolebias whitei]